MQPIDTSEAEVVSIVYDGGLAESGQLQFYEFSRASYAFARFVSTIEYFRRTGQVATRISRKHSTHLIIKAPEKGSFPLDILIPIAIDIAKEAPKYAQVPIKIILKYIMHSVTSRLSPKQEKETLALGKIFLELEKERTNQSAEETKRIEAVERMVISGNVSNQAALDVVKRLINEPNTRISEAQSNSKSMSEIARRLEEHSEREVEFQPYKHQLESIGQDKLVKLTRKVRPQIAEIGLPLRNSADIIRFSTGTERKTFATYDQKDISEINSRTLDEKAARTELRVFAYDKDSGIGKCDVLEENLLRASFLIPVQTRSHLKKKILRAMDRDSTLALVRYFRNKDGKITSIQIEDILLEDMLYTADIVEEMEEE